MKLNPEVYRRAAERYTDRAIRYPYKAIWMETTDSSEHLYYCNWFDAVFGGRWFGDPEIPENRLARQLALLLMAEIVGSE